MNKKLKFKSKENYHVTVEIELKKEKRIKKDYTSLKEVKNCYVLSIRGEVKDNNYNFSSCGQCIDEINKLSYTKKDRVTINKIVKIWEQYHLNDMQAGTKNQEALLPEHCDYDRALKILTKQKLLSDRGHKYGSKWLIKVIPDSIIKDIRDICNN